MNNSNQALSYHQKQQKAFKSWQKHTLKSKDLQKVFDHELGYAGNELQKPCIVESNDQKRKQDKITRTNI